MSGDDSELLLMSEGINPVLEEKIKEHVDQFVEPKKAIDLYRLVIDDFKVPFDSMDSLSIDFSGNISFSFRGTASLNDVLKLDLLDPKLNGCLYLNGELVFEIKNISISCNALESNLWFLMLSGKNSSAKP